ncbi:probable protein MET1, chloroplastic at C-terminar half [Coccomyxa sp. Obi]|nr:probable protein MET1, chloroplastic at C-terminar half [Coccomyxa sp. Obi]
MLQHVLSLSQAQIAQHCHGGRLETCLKLIRQQPRRLRSARPALAMHTTAVTDKLPPVANGRASGLDKQDVQEQSGQAAPSTDSTANSGKPSISARPQSSSEAIQRGIEELKAGRPNEAIELFQAALELPGNGCMRFAGTVREYRCASEGEEQAALYNMACAYAALRQTESALTCLEGAFEAGLSDYAAVRSDPDLDAVRGPELDKLVSKYDNLLAKVFKKRRDDADKPWLGW